MHYEMFFKPIAHLNTKTMKEGKIDGLRWAIAASLHASCCAVQPRDHHLHETPSEEAEFYFLQ
jgi:hypothetical protein